MFHQELITWYVLVFFLFCFSFSFSVFYFFLFLVLLKTMNYLVSCLYVSFEISHLALYLSFYHSFSTYMFPIILKHVNSLQTTASSKTDFIFRCVDSEML